jgi:hypothetical protein
MAKRKPRKRYSRSLVVDHFDAMHGNTRPCSDGECPIVVAMDGRIGVAEATRLDPPLVNAFDRYCRSEFGSATRWECLTASEICRITRDVMKAA